jgi:hypothetical protein
VQKKSSRKFQRKKIVEKISSEKNRCGISVQKIWLQNFSGKKLSRKFLREKNCSEISAEKFGCENSAEKKCRGISAKKIWLQNFRGKNKNYFERFSGDRPNSSVG